jgi:hypothetical protein
MVFDFYIRPYGLRCHGLVPWSLTLAATNGQPDFQMPRACPVEFHARCYNSCQRETPRDKPVASSREPVLLSCQRETPRDKPVASSSGRTCFSKFIIKRARQTDPLLLAILFPR